MASGSSRALEPEDCVNFTNPVLLPSLKATRSSARPLTRFFLGEGSPTKIDCRKKKRFPYSNLSTGEDLALKIFLEEEKKT